MKTLSCALLWAAAASLFIPPVSASPYRDDLVQWNLNVNRDAQHPTEYESWRIPATIVIYHALYGQSMGREEEADAA